MKNVLNSVVFHSENNITEKENTELDVIFSSENNNKNNASHCLVYNETSSQCEKCEDGYYILKGSCLECAFSCKGKLCRNFDGYSNECFPEHFGHFCDRKCSENCKKTEKNLQNSTRFCDRMTGECVFGCIE